jgi:hypothetical protein
MNLHVLKVSLISVSSLVCAIATAWAEPSCPACSPSSPGFDKDSGLCFPGAIAGLKNVPQSAASVAEDKADNVTTLNFLDEKAPTILVTVRAFDRTKPQKGLPQKALDSMQMKALESWALETHPGAKMPQKEAGKFELGGREYPADGRVFTWPDAGQLHVMFAWGMAQKKRYIIITTEYLTHRTDDGALMLRAAEVQTKVASQICAAR